MKLFRVFQCFSNRKFRAKIVFVFQCVENLHAVFRQEREKKAEKLPGNEKRETSPRRVTYLPAVIFTRLFFVWKLLNRRNNAGAKGNCYCRSSSPRARFDIAGYEIYFNGLLFHNLAKYHFFRHSPGSAFRFHFR